MAKRVKTNYPGVFYRETGRIGGSGTEKVYYILFKRHGKAYEEKAGRQYIDAMTAARAAGIRAELIEGKRQTRKEIRKEAKAKKKIWTIDNLWQEYKNQKAIKGIGPDESRYQKHLKSMFGNKEPQDILPLDVERLRRKMLKTLKPQTVKNVLRLLTRITTFGFKQRLSVPLSFTIEIGKIDNEKTEDLTLEQLTKLLEAIEEDIHPQAASMMKMALFTGLRRGELFKLQWKHIDYERGFINIRDPKGVLSQKVPLNDATRDLLELHLKTDSPFVFPGRDGNQRTNIAKQVNRIKKKAGLPEDFRALHGLRHTYASMLASSGQVDMYTLQKLLCHKDASMTQRYAHLRDETLKRASNLAGDIINQVINKNKTVIEIKGKNEK